MSNVGSIPANSIWSWVSSKHLHLVELKWVGSCCCQFMIRVLT